jgi:hypothetical protein
MHKLIEPVTTIGLIFFIALAIVYAILRKKINNTSVVQTNNRVEIYKKGKLVRWYYVDTHTQIINAENVNA